MLRTYEVARWYIHLVLFIAALEQAGELFQLIGNVLYSSMRRIPLAMIIPIGVCLSFIACAFLFQRGIVALIVGDGISGHNVVSQPRDLVSLSLSFTGFALGVNGTLDWLNLASHALWLYSQRPAFYSFIFDLSYILGVGGSALFQATLGLILIFAGRSWMKRRRVSLSSEPIHGSSV